MQLLGVPFLGKRSLKLEKFLLGEGSSEKYKRELEWEVTSGERIRTMVGQVSFGLGSHGQPRRTLDKTSPQTHAHHPTMPTRPCCKVNTEQGA